MSLLEGTTYGTPADVQGLDPRACTANQRSVGITTGNPLSADYTSCSFALTSDGTTPGNLYIPNPQTGTFDTFGEFRMPWQFNLGAQMAYDFTPRLSGASSSPTCSIVLWRIERAVDEGLSAERRDLRLHVKYLL